MCVVGGSGAKTSAVLIHWTGDGLDAPWASAAEVFDSDGASSTKPSGLEAGAARAPSAACAASRISATAASMSAFETSSPCSATNAC